jgi:molybdopterin-guanine dinucleotide biosynthesis adapter protein
MSPPLIALQAPSGTGKTMLMTGMISALHGVGLRVAALKHAGHAHPLDKPGSDSQRYRDAGAMRSAVMNQHTLAVFGPPPPGGPRALAAALFPDADLVLAEGWRGHGLPALRVSRAGGPPWHDWTTPDPVVAWATDAERSPDGTPALPLDQPAVVARWICTHLGVAWPGGAPARP